MRLVFVLFVAFLLSSPATRADTPPQAALDEALRAYRDSFELGHKADTFLHARRAYFIAIKLFSGDPESLAPVVHTYANAAARFREPIALGKYEQALDLLVEAYGRDSQALYPVLVDAAEEAIVRREPERAYAWIRHAEKLAEAYALPEGWSTVRLHMGRARLYERVGDLTRANQHADMAIALAETHNSDADPITYATVIYWHGHVKRASGANSAARESYLQSLELYKTFAPDTRRILTLHKRLVEMSHKLGDQEALIRHCYAVNDFLIARGSGSFATLFHPIEHQIDDRYYRSGDATASFTVGADCRPHNIVVHHARGVSLEEAFDYIAASYYAPKLVDGVIDPEMRLSTQVMLRVPTKR